MKTVSPRPKAAAQKTSPRMAPPDRALSAMLDELLGARPGLRKGRMFGCPAYFVGTKAVACVFEDKLNLTLPPSHIDELVKTSGFRRFEPRGRPMNGWVLIDQQRLSTLDPDDELFDLAIAHAGAKAQKSSPTPKTRKPRRT